MSCQGEFYKKLPTDLFGCMLHRMNDDFSIDFSAAPTPNPEEQEKVRKLTMDCLNMLVKSLFLEQEAEGVFGLVMKFCEKYKNVDPETVEWQEREKIYDEANALMAVWMASVKKLKRTR